MSVTEAILLENGPENLFSSLCRLSWSQKDLALCTSTESTDCLLEGWWSEVEMRYAWVCVKPYGPVNHQVYGNDDIKEGKICVIYVAKPAEWLVGSPSKAISSKCPMKKLATTG
jgi:hypothetical protein